MDQIGSDDIQELIDSAVPEGEQIEFKRSLPTEDGSTDPWECGADRIGRSAKKKIVEEAVAFANAYGGALVLGIRESEDEAKPGIAEEITAIPRCADLAKRLNLVFRDWVDPQIPRIDIFPVPVKGDDGVVIIRTGRSRMAPHRVKPTRKCPIRRADRCEELTMREIQDLTINTARGLERLDRRLAERSARFQREFKCLSDRENGFGIRMTALPVADEIRIDRVFHGTSLIEEFNEPWRAVLDIQGRPIDRYPGIVPIVWRPMVSAARADSHLGTSSADRNVYMEVHCDGLVEVGYVSGPWSVDPNEIGSIYLAISLPIDMLANLIVQSHCTRNQSGAPMIEYAIEVEICAKRQVVLMASTYATSPLGSVNAGSELFPRYSLGSPDEALSLLRRFRRDFRNLLGHDLGDSESELVIEDWPA